MAKISPLTTSRNTPSAAAPRSSAQTAIGTDRSSGAVVSALDSQRGIIDRLENVAEQLEETLKAVSCEDYPPEPIPAPPPTPNALSRSIEEHNDRLNSLSARLIKLKNRISI